MRTISLEMQLGINQWRTDICNMQFYLRSQCMSEKLQIGSMQHQYTPPLGFISMLD